jgi:hypothetical protein
LDACHFDNSCTFLAVSIYFDYNVCFDLCYFARAGNNCFDLCYFARAGNNCFDLCYFARAGNNCFDLCYFALAAYNCFDFPLTFYNWAYCVGESFAANNFAVENWMVDPDTVWLLVCVGKLCPVLLLYEEFT